MHLSLLEFIGRLKAYAGSYDIRYFGFHVGRGTSLMLSVSVSVSVSVHGESYSKSYPCNVL